MRLENKVSADIALYSRVVVILNDERCTQRVGWFVKDQWDAHKYCVLCDNDTITSFSASNIKYLAYLNGSCIFKGYGKWLVPIFTNESHKDKMKRIQLLLDGGSKNE